MLKTKLGTLKDPPTGRYHFDTKCMPKKHVLSIHPSIRCSWESGEGTRLMPPPQKNKALFRGLLTIILPRMMLLEGSFPPTPKADSLLYFGHGRRKKGCRAHHASHLHSGSPHQDSTVKFQPRDRNNTCETTEPPSCLLSMEKIWSSNVSWESFRSPASPRWRDEQCSMTIFCTRWVCLNMSQEKKIHWFPTQLAILCGCLVRIVLETLRFGIMIQSVSKEFRTSQEVYK